jgi:RNA 3'-terminal phosphate cyclase (ATP)
MVEIDGSYGEGGGQVLRTTLALSAITGRPVRLYAIRARRPRPGLAPQHLAVVLALARICRAEVRGAALRSAIVEFAPQSPPLPGTYHFDVAEAGGGASAGAISLILQALLLPLAFAAGDSQVLLRGGTHVPWSPSFHYLERVFTPTVARMGITLALRLDAWGFYPVGGGQVSAIIHAARRPLRAVDLLHPGPLRGVTGLAAAANLPAHIPQRMASRAASLLAESDIRARVQPVRERAASPGAALLLVAEYVNARAGFSALGKKGKPSEQVAEEATLDLLASHKSGQALDMHLADQILLPAALAEGSTTYTTCRVTEHLRTNAHVLSHFLGPVVAISGALGYPGTVSVAGNPL